MKKFWLALYYMIASRLPGPPLPGSKVGHIMRRQCAKKLFSSVGDDVIIGAGVNFGSGSNIVIGSGSNIGRGSWISNDTILGDHVMMGPETIILSYNHKTNEEGIPYSKQGFTERSPVIVGNNVWIGARAILLAGTKVGDNCIIGAGTVVTKPIPAGCVVVGNPAKIVRQK